jgi:uncharacterized protein (DUF433 family)
MGGKPVYPILEQHREEIINSYQNGASIDELSSRFGCSNTPIRRFLMNNGVKLRPPVRPLVLARNKDQVLAMYAEGANTREIADRFGVDRNTVSLFLHKHNARRNTPLSPRTFFIDKDTDRGVLAGLLLGEGSIIIRGKGVSIRIVNQDAAILGWLAQFGGKLYWSKPRKRCPNPTGIWDLSGAVDVYHCLTSLEPLLVGKKKSLARAALKVLKNNYGLGATP